MEITFDPEKDKRTRRNRGLSLAVGAEVIRNQVWVMADDRHNYGETRYIAFGYVGKRLHVCVYTVREESIRIISVRKANDREIKRYGR